MMRWGWTMLLIDPERMVGTVSCYSCLRECVGDVCPECESRLRREEMLRLYDEEFDNAELSRAGYEPGETYIEPWEF